jgi:hypothetical protein
VSDCCFTLIQQFFTITCREQVNFQWDDDEVHFVLAQHAELDFYSQDRQYNGQKKQDKGTNNDVQKIIQKTKANLS